MGPNKPLGITRITVADLARDREEKQRKIYYKRQEFTLDRWAVSPKLAKKLRQVDARGVRTDAGWQTHLANMARHAEKLEARARAAAAADRKFQWAGAFIVKSLEPAVLVAPVSRQALRSRIYEEASGKCYYCRIEMCYLAGDKIRPHDFTIDHVIPRSKGGPDELWNLVACCRACNARKGDREIWEW